ncbi:MAG: chemotaxis protein CheW [Rhodospirillales bacterium]
MEAENALTTTTGRNLQPTSSVGTEDFVTFEIEDQLFGIPVLKIQDILKPEKIASVPLAPPEIRGSINLRGRIVTVIDVRVRLGLKPGNADESMGVTVEHHHDLYTLLVDKIGDVISLASSAFDKAPDTLDPKWRQFAVSVVRLEKRLMVVLDVERMLEI